MQQRFQKNLLLLICLIFLVATISGCASSSSTGSLETGVVTETTMTDTIETSGSVSAKQIATLTWKTSGNVLEVNVENNDQVTSGEELLKLESTSAPTEVLEAISTLVTAKQNLAYVQESNTALAEAEVALVEAQTAYNDARNDWFDLDDPVGNAEYIEVLKKDYILAQKSTARAYTRWCYYSEANNENPDKIAAYADLAQARINEFDALTRLNHFSNPPTALEAEAVQAAYDLAKSNLAAAQNNYDQIKAGNVDAITVAQAAVDAAQATVNKLSIIAPFDGEVAVVYSQKGDVVSKGTEALVLVDRSQLSIDVQVDEDSISSVQVGNPVSVSFEALGIETTGKVALIDPIGVTSSNVVNYTVQIDLDESDPDILIGATATVVITTGDPHNVLFVPVSAVLTDNEGEYVTRIKSDGSSERVSVKTGDISDEKVEVSGDLSKGDAVQLYTTTTTDDSSSNQNRGGGLFGLGGFLR